MLSRQAWIARESYLRRAARLRRIPPAARPRARGLHAVLVAHRVGLEDGFRELDDSPNSSASRTARATNSTTGTLYVGHPQFEGFEVRQHITATGKAA